MKAIRSHYLFRRTSLALSLIFVFSLLTPCLTWAQEPVHTVLVLPVTVAAEGAPLDLSESAAGALTMALDDIRDYNAMQLSPTSPSVRRAISEGRIRQVDVQEGVGDIATALSMAAALKTDMVVMATIQSYTATDTPAAVELIMSGQMYDVAANINPTTGLPVAEPKVLRAFGVSGASTQRARYTGREIVLAQEAVRDAAVKAAQTLTGTTDVTQITTTRKGKNTTQKWLLLGLLLAGAVIAISSGGDDGGAAPSPDALPPANVTLEPDDTAVRITWSAPANTSLQVLRYQIERSVDGAGFQRIDPGILGPGSVFLLDTETLAGRHAYQYRMRTIYTSGDISPWVNTGTIIVTR